MISWLQGGDAAVVKFAEPFLVVRSSISSAPGRPLQGVLAPQQLTVIVKVKSCKKDGDAFVIEGRLVNLTKELRGALSTAS